MGGTKRWRQKKENQTKKQNNEKPEGKKWSLLPAASFVPSLHLKINLSSL